MPFPMIEELAEEGKLDGYDYTQMFRDYCRYVLFHIHIADWHHFRFINLDKAGGTLSILADSEAFWKQHESTFFFPSNLTYGYSDPPENWLEVFSASENLPYHFVSQPEWRSIQGKEIPRPEWDY